jgi:chaperonin cofactor prefoldin
MASAGGPQPDERAILDHFQGLRSDVDALWSKITELDLERQEHALVLETLVPLEAGRRCFRLVGGVLVERTVGEVAPAVSRNREALEEVRLWGAGRGAHGVRARCRIARSNMRCSASAHALLRPNPRTLLTRAPPPAHS